MQPAVLVACNTEATLTAWDLSNGSQLTQFKTNSSGRNCLCQLGPDYFAAAQNTKDAVHFWTWHKDQVHQRCFAQEPLTALAASPDGAYLAAGGASGTLYLWCTSSGALLRSWPAHYKAVSCVVFSDDGGLLVSGGDDTLVASWLLAEVLDQQRDSLAAAAVAAMASSRVEPLHTWSEHTLPITCLCLGMGGGSALLVTASLDRTVKLWAVGTGQLLRSLTLPAGVTSVTLDAGEHVLLAGCVDGSIYEASLVGPRAQQLQQQLPGRAAGGASGSGAGDARAAAAAAAGLVGGPGSCCYEGHSKAVSSLAITPDGEQLVSGAEDGTVRVWDLRSRQCLRVITAPHKAPVSGVLLLELAARMLGAAGQAGSGRAAPKRMQPLAPLAKFTGAGGASKPWEGPNVVLDASSCWQSSAAATEGGCGLFLQPWAEPLQALQLPPAGQPELGGAAAVAAAAASGAGAAAAAPAAVGADVGGSDVVRLQAQVQQLQRQLQESRQVAQQWQELHGQLHQFCTEQVLAPPAAAATTAQ